MTETDQQLKELLQELKTAIDNGLEALTLNNGITPLYIGQITGIQWKLNNWIQENYYCDHSICNATVAQPVEQSARNGKVVGSKPTSGSKFMR